MCIGEDFYPENELRNIRRGLKQLKQIQTSDIKYRIQLLKEINDLLKEQNRILVMRQQLLAQRSSMKELKVKRAFLQVS